MNAQQARIIADQVIKAKVNYSVIRPFIENIYQHIRSAAGHGNGRITTSLKEGSKTDMAIWLWFKSQGYELHRPMGMNPDRVVISW